MSLQWCCKGFEWYYQQAGERDFAMLVGRDEQGDPVFILQHRAIRMGDSLESTEVPLSLVSETRILFCPWCGRSLVRWYRKAIDQLARPGLRIELPKVEDERTD
jgi:hypothetical protein